MPVYENYNMFQFVIHYKLHDLVLHVGTLDKRVLFNRVLVRKVNIFLFCKFPSKYFRYKPSLKMEALLKYDKFLPAATASIKYISSQLCQNNQQKIN